MGVIIEANMPFKTFIGNVWDKKMDKILKSSPPFFSLRVFD